MISSDTKVEMEFMGAYLLIYKQMTKEELRVKIETSSATITKMELELETELKLNKISTHELM